MENTGFDFAKKQARRNGRNSILLSLLVLAALAVLKGVVLRGAVANTFGPYAGFTSSLELEGLYDGGRPWVTFRADELFDAGYVQGEDGKARWNFFAFWAGDEYVICRTPLSYTNSSYENFTVKGKLAEYSGDYRRLRTMLITDLEEMLEIDSSEARQLVSPYMIYLDHSRIPDQMLFAGVAAVAVLALLNIARAARGMVDVTATGSYRKMAKTPGADPAAMNEQLSLEMAAGQVRFKHKWCTVTENWVAETRATRFAIYPKRDVVWIYRTVTQHRTNGIPSGKTHAVTLCTLHQAVMTIPARGEKGAVSLMEALQGCGFSAVFAFTPELQRMYHSNREQFVALARQQRPPAPRQPVPGYGVAPGYGAAPAVPNAASAGERLPPGGGAVNVNNYKGPEL